ncbi:MAG: helix-turn-helix domain-containing protein [Bryobacter sp.]|nr:helix-turn-helix domain-containing protein [Bryobacter sp.]
MLVYKRAITYSGVMGRPKTVADDELLRIARTEFSQQGHAASTRMIAQTAGISQATLFQRFGDKERLFLAANTPPPLEAALIVGKLRRTETASSYLTKVAIRLHLQVSERAPLVLLLARELTVKPADVAEAHSRLGETALVSALTDQIEILQRDHRLDPNLSPASLIEALLVAIHGLVLMDLMARGSGPPAEAALQRLVSLLTHQTQQKRRKRNDCE